MRTARQEGPYGPAELRADRVAPGRNLGLRVVVIGIVKGQIGAGSGSGKATSAGSR